MLTVSFLDTCFIGAVCSNQNRRKVAQWKPSRWRLSKICSMAQCIIITQSGFLDCKVVLIPFIALSISSQVWGLVLAITSGLRQSNDTWMPPIIEWVLLRPRLLWAHITNFVQLFMSNTITNPIILLFTRISILLLYMRIFKIDRNLRAAIYAGFFVNIAFYTIVLGFGIRAIVECVDMTWVTNKYCRIVQLPLYTAVFSFNVAMEIYLMILPISRIVKLHLSLNRRIGLVIVFASGFL